MRKMRVSDGFRQTTVSLLTATLTVIISNTAFSATKYEIAVPPRLSLNESVGQALIEPASRLIPKTRGKIARSNQTANPTLVGQQLYHALKQSSGATGAGLKSSKKGVARGVSIAGNTQQILQSLNTQLRDAEGVKVYFDTSKGTPTFIKPNNLSIKPKFNGLTTTIPSKPAVARQFLKDNRALLKLDNPESELQQISQTTDSQNKTHFRFQQTVNGVVVWGKQVLVHLDRDDGVYLFQGRYEPTLINISTVPKITEQTAVDSVLHDLNFTGVLNEPAHTELAVYTKADGSAVLTYKVELSPAIEDRWVYFIDAATGVVVHRIYNIHKNVVQGSGVGLDGTTHTFNVWNAQNGTFYLIDPDTPTPGGNADPVADGPRPTGDTYILNANNGDGSQLFFNTHSAQTNWPDPVAISASHNTRLVYEYYLDTFGRNSIDGNGKNLMTVVHFENNFDNAFWNGTFMVYGDGGDFFSPLAGCLDVAGHEMTHGVIETTAGLIYENQSGALNESFADVFGVMIDDSNWLVGENCTKSAPLYLRSMSNPANGLGGGQPAHMNQYQNLPNTPNGDNGGVHINSGIPNRAAYLIAEGLSSEGLGASIGRADTEQIYYRALTTYLTQSSQFIDARRALIQAAEDLYGVNSVQTQAVATAFDAVGVTDSDATPPPTPPDARPTPTEPVSGDDVMVYLYPADKIHDDPQSELLYLYAQTMGGDDVGPYNLAEHGDLTAFYTRPAAVTTQDGTFYLYVASDHNAYEAVLNGTDSRLSNTGDIFSIAISPNNRYIAYTTTYQDDNNVYVVDFDNNGAVTAYPILSENYQGGGTATGNTILYADALAFDYTSNIVVFDALNCLSTPNNLCSENAGYRYWSIGILDLNTGQFFFPIANQSPDVDLGYPSFAANNNYVITLDLLDYTDTATSGINSQAITIDFETQTISTVHNFGYDSTPFWSVPSFWGGDDYITLQAPAFGTQSGNISASKVQINASWQGISALQAINNYAVAMPSMHRAAVRELTGRLVPNVSAIDFTEVGPQQILTMSNPGNSDVNITNISIDNLVFSTTATNTRVPAGQEFQIEVTSAVQNVREVGRLVIQHDGLGGDVTIKMISFNQKPTIVSNGLVVEEGGTVVLTANNLSATDLDDNNNELTFLVSSLSGGQFESTAFEGIAIGSFTVVDVNAGNVQFVHDGGESPPVYNIEVSDGFSSNLDGPQAASIAFTNVNDPPVITNNRITVNKGQVVMLTSSNLSANDEDNDNAGLQFTISSVRNGHFQRASGVVVNTFTQADVSSGDIQFVHDASQLPPGYEVSVSDGVDSNVEGPLPASVTFNSGTESRGDGNSGGGTAYELVLLLLLAVAMMTSGLFRKRYIQQK